MMLCIVFTDTYFFFFFFFFLGGGGGWVGGCTWDSGCTVRYQILFLIFYFILYLTRD